jgi:hypothetical protein
MCSRLVAIESRASGFGRQIGVTQESNRPLAKGTIGAEGMLFSLSAFTLDSRLVLS